MRPSPSLSMPSHSSSGTGSPDELEPSSVPWAVLLEPSSGGAPVLEPSPELEELPLDSSSVHSPATAGSAKRPKRRPESHPPSGCAQNPGATQYPSTPVVRHCASSSQGNG